jgi:hypothetical protein
MTTHDTPEAALLNALRDEWPSWTVWEAEMPTVEFAAAILAAMPDWRLVPADAVSADAHKPGDPHQYRITCEVCGERGAIRLTVDPETAPPDPKP